MKWFSSYSFVTAIPEVVHLFSPEWYSKATDAVSPYVNEHVIALSLGIFGLFFASFLTWREEYVQNKSPLYARIRQTRCFPQVDAPNLTTIWFSVDLRNGGPPTVATDWLLCVGNRRLARASERTFFLDSQSPIDPQKTPLPQGASAYGTLTFTVQISVPEAERVRQRWRLTCRDAGRREVLADDIEANGL